MDAAEHDEKLHQILGVFGPIGTIMLPSGRTSLIYRLPDKTEKHVVPPQYLTPEQRAEQIAEISRHIDEIRNKRGPATTSGKVL